MTVTLLTLPSTLFSGIDLDPTHYVASTISRGNYPSDITFADPLWQGSLTTVKLTEKELRKWEAFIAEASERKLPFEFVHPTKRVPAAYSLATLPWSGAATFASLSSLRQPHIAGLPVGLVLQRGDRVTVTEGDYCAHRMVATDVTVSSYSDQAIDLAPRLPLGAFTLAASLTFKDPKMRLRVIANSWKAPLQAGDAPVGTFQVVESPL